MQPKEITVPEVAKRLGYSLPRAEALICMGKIRGEGYKGLGGQAGCRGGVPGETRIRRIKQEELIGVVVYILFDARISTRYLLTFFLRNEVHPPRMASQLVIQ